MSEIAIFADGGTRIGYGHLTRMRTLCARLQANIRLFTRTPEAANRIFDDAKIPVSELGVPLEARFQEIAEAHNLFVLDPPYKEEEPDGRSGPAWRSCIAAAQASKCPIAFFTDEDFPTAHLCDLLINDHPSASAFAESYRDMGFTGKLLAGAQHFLIDAAHDINERSADTLFVSFGGGDQQGIVAKLLPVLRDFGHIAPVELVVGPGYAGIPNAGPVRVLSDLSPANFARHLRRARMALTASGNTLFERVFHGVPGVTLAQSPHQDTIGRAFAGIGVAEHLGLGSTLDVDMLRQSLHRIWQDEAALDAQKKAAMSVNIRNGCAEILDALHALMRRA